MRKTILAVLIVLLFSVQAWAIENFKDELFMKTQTTEITNAIKETHVYREGWFYGVSTTNFSDLRDIVGYLAQDSRQMSSWQYEPDGARHVSYQMKGEHVVIYLTPDQLLIVAH